MVPIQRQQDQRIEVHHVQIEVEGGRFLWVDGHLPNCFVGLPSKHINRDEFFNAISASVELKFIADRTRSQLRMETYEIDRQRASNERGTDERAPPWAPKEKSGSADFHFPPPTIPEILGDGSGVVRLNIASQLDGTMSSVLFSRLVPSPFNIIPDWARLP